MPLSLPLATSYVCPHMLQLSEVGVGGVFVESLASVLHRSSIISPLCLSVQVHPTNELGKANF